MLVGALANGAGRVAVYALVLVVPVILLNQGGAGQTGLGVFWARMTMPLLLLIGLRWSPRVAVTPLGAMGRLAALARDQAPFFAIAAAYAVLRLGLYVAGLGRLMYGTETHLRFAPTTLLDSATSYLLIGVGAWEAPQEVALWPTLIKVGIVLAALLVAAGAVRWVRGPALFAVLWVPATLLVTFDTAADRWFYVPALGVCLLAALLIYRAGTAQPAVRWALAAGLVLIWGGETAGVNARWVESGEVARGLIAQIRTLQPNPPRPATFYMANPPATYHGILLFNSGFSEAPSFAYQDYTTVKGYELQEHAGQVQAALSDPAQVGPHPFFLRYENGRLVAYPSLAALVAAQAKAGGP